MRCFRNVCTSVAMMLCAFGGRLASAQMTPIASQLPDPTGLVGAVADATEVSFYQRMAAERFVPAEDCVAQGFSFWGYSEFYFFPDPINVSSFRIRIYADAGGLPGDAIHDEIYELSSFHISDSEMLGHSGGIIGRLTADLTQAIPMSGGVPYWFSVSANYHQFDGDAFVWAAALSGDHARGRFGHATGQWTLDPGDTKDLAFVVRGTVSAKGACCLPNGDCTTVTAQACAAASGLFHGDDTSCTVYGASATLNAPISDGGPGISHTIHIDDDVSISDLQIQLYLEHDWIGDLTATISYRSPAGVTRTADLFRRVDVEAFGGLGGLFGDRSAVDGSYTFNDRSPGFDGFWANSTATIAVVPPGAHDAVTNGGAPVDLFATLFPPGSGPPSFAGDWTISVRDEEVYFSGFLRSWRLIAYPVTPPDLCEAPPPQTGACCDLSGVCSTRTETDCAAISGVFQGVASVCLPTLCPPPPSGGCCTPDGICVVLPQPTCQSLGLVYQGDDTTCHTAQCPARPTYGACCNVDGSCSTATQASCAAFGGSYQGDRTECIGAVCPQPPPVGACCIVGRRCGCDLRTEADCLSLGGNYHGDESTCDAQACEGAACACDWNGMGGLDSQDYFDFVEDFLLGDGDYNCQDGTDSQDLFDFVECFVFAPPGCS